MNYFKESFARFIAGLTQIANRFGQRKLLYLSVLFVALAYSFLSILRHLHFTSRVFDLGVFDQAIWQYSRFHAPYTSIRSNLLSENLLGDHFHPIVALLAPLYWLTNHVESLLIVQALLFAIAIIPIFLFTEKRLGKIAAYLFAFSYAIFWGIQNAVESDFHEVAFAVPAISLAIYFIGQRKWCAYFICMGVLLLTKENLSITVVFFGVYLLAIKQYKRGLATIAAGVFWFFAALKLFIPFFKPSAGPGSSYAYWSYNRFGTNLLSALWTMIRDPLSVIRTLFSPSLKVQTYWYTFYPFLFLPFFSPLFILAIPLIAERFLSDRPHFWGINYHYTATLAPVIVMASADSLFRITRRLGKARRYLVISTSILVFAANLLLLPKFPLWNLTSAAYRWPSVSDTIGRKAISMIPPTASAAASDSIAPHLTHRQEIYVLNPSMIPDAEFIIASESVKSFPFRNFQEIRYYLDYQQARGYRKVFDQEGWIVLWRQPIAEKSVVVYNDAAFVDQLVPTVMTAGQSYSAQVTMRNTGIGPWSSGDAYSLALSSVTGWGIERVGLSSTVPANSSVTFKFTVKAPSVPGEYSFHCRMIQEGLMLFGENTPEVSVTVSSGSVRTPSP